MAWCSRHHFCAAFLAGDGNIGGEKCIYPRPYDPSEITANSLVNQGRDNHGRHTKKQGIEEQKRKKEKPFVWLIQQKQ